MVDSFDSDPDIEKRRPKPFRYITTLDEGTEAAATNEKFPISVMTDEMTQSKKLHESVLTPVCLGDVSAIESVVRRHEGKRDKKTENQCPDPVNDMLIRIRDIHNDDGSGKTNP